MSLIFAIFETNDLKIMTMPFIMWEKYINVYWIIALKDHLSLRISVILQKLIQNLGFNSIRISNMPKNEKKLWYFMKILRFINENHVIPIIKTMLLPLHIIDQFIWLIRICEWFDKPYVEIGTILFIIYESIKKKLMARQWDYFYNIWRQNLNKTTLKQILLNALYVHKCFLQEWRRLNIYWRAMSWKLIKEILFQSILN